MPDRLLRIILRLLLRLFGLVLMGFSLAFLLALLTFNSNDPSFNTVSTQDYIENWMGSFGSHISDLSFQLIGTSSFFLCLIIFSIGAKVSSRFGIRNLLPKIIITPFAILCCSVFFATLPQPSWWEFSSLGGVNGGFILAKLDSIPLLLISAISLFLTFLLISIIIEISFKDWFYFLRYAILIMKYLYGRIVNFVKNNDNNFRPRQGEIMASIPDEEALPEEEELQDNEESELRFGYDNEEEEDVEETRESLKEKLKSTKTKRPTRARKSNYQLPTSDLLTDRSSENKDKKISRDIVEKQSEMLLKVLDDFGVEGSLLGAKVGPVVTLHEFEPIAGTKASRVIGLSDDIARSMSAISARIAVVLGRTSIGIELPNPKREMIFLRELIECKDYKFSQNFLPIILGKDIAGDIMIADLAKMPHLLIAGTTGSGKSVGLNVMILSLLFKLRPDECKFIMIDPKMLELSIYDGIPHLLSPVVTEPGKAVIALKWVVAEMEERYRLMSSFAVRNVAGYNEKVQKAILTGEKLSRKVQTGYDPSTGRPIIEELEFEPKKLPFIVVIVDEMADLMLVAGKEIENSVQRLAQMARAAGIHLIMATQRPSVDVITGVIKANFPTRISFQVTSRIDSRTILGAQGAEQLLGQGDMIYMSGGAKMTRVHGPFCSDTEIENIVNFIKEQDLSEFGEGEKISFEAALPRESGGEEGSDFEAGSDGDLYNKAVMIVRRDKKASISYVQRQLRIGYNRAATLVEKMEEEGVITPPNISGKREVIEE
jgi:DNA segregation ATPase FtsK/SpoIIIE, S-DNA-T family